MADRFQLARADSATWAALNPTPREGEICLETDTTKYKIGDGVTPWSTLPYGSLSGAVSGLDLTATTDPVAPTNAVTIYSKDIAGRIMPKWISPSGFDTPFQPFIGMNRVAVMQALGGSNAFSYMGYPTVSVAGTATVRAITQANLFTRMQRLGYVSVATVGGLASVRAPLAQYSIGDGTGYGGFFKVMRFGCSDAATVAGARQFCGMGANTGAPTNVEPSTLLNSFGVGHGAADTNLKMFYGGAVAQAPIDLGANFPANTLSADMYELALYSPANQTGIVKYRVTRLNTGHVAAGAFPVSNGVVMPSPATMLTGLWAYRTNNATALAVGLDICSDYLEKDF